MLQRENTVLVVVDVQGKLATLMHEKESLFQNLERVIQGARVLNIPILLTEQYPKGLGHTLASLQALIPEVKPIEKLAFSCYADAGFNHALHALNRNQVLLCGIETHVCVYQTARDLLAKGFEVEVVADAVSSRTNENKQIGLERLREHGAKITSTEMCLFDLLHIAGSEEFKAISKLVK